MTRQERFTEIIAEIRRQQWRTRVNLLSNEEWWEEMRDVVIESLLIDAAAALNQAGLNSGNSVANGGSGAFLEVEPSGPPSSRLTFTHREEGVQITSTEPGLKREDFDRGHFTEEIATAKVEAFLTIIASKYPAAKAGKLTSGWG